MYLGVDGGGTKTAYAVIDPGGRIRARHVGPSISHLSEGLARAKELLLQGIRAVVAEGGIEPSDLTFAFIGLPAYGEDSALTADLDATPADALRSDHYRCGNDMLCSWAGSLACSDGISVIAGTGSMAYGEYGGRNARSGGWGELIGDEGSAYWIAHEGMNLFSRMSDGRAPRGRLYQLVRERFAVTTDLDLCARIYGEQAGARRAFAQFAQLVDEAARGGDPQALAILERAADELVQCVVAVRRALDVPDHTTIPVSHTGGVLQGSALTLEAFRSLLARTDRPFEYRVPRFPPEIGAALYAARLAGKPLGDAALVTLSQSGSLL